MQALAEKKGVKFELNAKIKEIRSDVQQVSSVETQDKSIPTDLVIFATGVRPVTNFAKGIELDAAVLLIRFRMGASAQMRI